jgi:5-amino-6-(5-phosphoribosylamino)uracil reductase
MVVSTDLPNNLPLTTVILAISADGKIADINHTAARFGSATDRTHLETQVAQVDAVLFGAATLRAYGTTLRVKRPDLLQQRQQQGKPPQPIQMVCSRSADFDPALPFFRQPVPRWLLTSTQGQKCWQHQAGFDRILVAATIADQFDWLTIFQQLTTIGIHRLAVLGGGTLVASLLTANLIDELWLTICPLLLGGATAPTPVAGAGWSEKTAPRLTLLEVRSQADEVFLHYRVLREC